MYTVDYFIQKFENTRDDKWTVRELLNDNGQSCALGWCGMFDTSNITDEAIALDDLLEVFFMPLKNYRNSVALINNGDHPNYQQPTPKQRILAALYDIKKMQQPQYTDITKELAILPTEETPDSITIKILQP